MNNMNVKYNPISRYRKGVMTTFGVMVAPFYVSDVEMEEGTVVVLDEANTERIVPAIGGECENGVFGIVAQKVYDPSNFGPLADYEFHNNTWARIGNAVGVIIGQGYIETLNYSGTIAYGDTLYADANGKLTKVKTGNDLPVGVSEGEGTDGDNYIRVRVNFNFYSDTVTTDVSTS